MGEQKRQAELKPGRLRDEGEGTLRPHFRRGMRATNGAWVQGEKTPAGDRGGGREMAATRDPEDSPHSPPLPMAAGDGKRDTRGGTTPLKWQRISASSRGAPELGHPASSGPWVPPPSLSDSETFGNLRLKIRVSSRGGTRRRRGRLRRFRNSGTGFSWGSKGGDPENYFSVTSP